MVYISFNYFLMTYISAEQVKKFLKEIGYGYPENKQMAVDLMEKEWENHGRNLYDVINKIEFTMAHLFVQDYGIKPKKGRVSTKKLIKIMKKKKIFDKDHLKRNLSFGGIGTVIVFIGLLSSGIEIFEFTSEKIINETPLSTSDTTKQFNEVNSKLDKLLDQYDIQPEEIDPSKKYYIPPDVLQQIEELENERNELKQKLNQQGEQITITIEQLLKEALAYYYGNEYEKSLDRFQIILKLEPNNIFALFNAGTILPALQSYEESITYFDRMLAIDPDNTAALSRKGWVFSYLSRYEEAITYFDKTLAINPDHVFALNSKGVALNGLEKHEDAILYFDRALKLDPNNHIMLYNKGNSLMKLGQYKDAIPYFDRVLEIDPNNVDGLINKGVSLWNLSRYEEAITYYDRVLAINPDHVFVLNNKGVALLELEKYEEAMRYFDRALTIDPNYISALNNKGSTLNKLSKYEEAITYYDRVLEIDPNNPTAIYNKSQMEKFLKK